MAALAVKGGKNCKSENEKLKLGKKIKTLEEKRCFTRKKWKGCFVRKGKDVCWEKEGMGCFEQK